MLDQREALRDNNHLRASAESSQLGDTTILALQSLEPKKGKAKEVLGLYTRQRKKLQIAMFILCYFSYGSIHVYREFWSTSKPIIEGDESKYNSDNQMLSNVDTVNFMVYGLTQFVSGAMGDAFPLKNVLPASFMLQAFCYTAIAVTGFVGGDLAYVQFFAWFSILGLVQSICFPAFVSIVANWVDEKQRGIAVGGFCTCVNIGNIVGVQVGAALLRAFSNQWQWLFVIMSVIAVVIAACLWLFLVPQPEEIGYIVTEEIINEKAALELRRMLRKTKDVHNRNVDDHLDMNGTEESASGAGGPGLSVSQRQQNALKDTNRRLTQIDERGSDEESSERGSQSNQRHPSLVLSEKFKTSMEREVKQEHRESIVGEQRISFWQAWLLPNAFFYAATNFLAKFALQVVFLSLFEWLKGDEIMLSQQEASNVSTMNDVGALIGSWSIGYVSDLTYGKRSPASLGAIIGSCVIFYLMFFEYDNLAYGSLMVCFLFYGMFIQSVTNTVAATCSADIGKNSGNKNHKAVSTVAGIIDGMGSVGASIGQFTVGATKSSYGYRDGYILVVAIVQTLTIIPLTKLTVKEVGEIRLLRYEKKISKLAGISLESDEDEMLETLTDEMTKDLDDGEVPPQQRFL